MRLFWLFLINYDLRKILLIFGDCRCIITSNPQTLLVALVCVIFENSLNIIKTIFINLEIYLYIFSYFYF